jgi:hypothetical protein
MEKYPDAANAIIKQSPSGAASVFKFYPKAAGSVINTNPETVINLMKSFPAAAASITKQFPEAVGTMLNNYPQQASYILKNNPAVSASLVRSSPGVVGELMEKYPETTDTIMKYSPTPGSASNAEPHQEQSSLMTSAVGGFLGAGLGSLLGASISPKPSSSALAVISDGEHEKPCISAPPNSMYMSKYTEPKDTEWTRGGPSKHKHSSHRRHYIDESNDADPYTMRYPGKNLKPTNLYSLHSHSNKSNSFSEPLNRKFNIEHDYSRE